MERKFFRGNFEIRDNEWGCNEMVLIALTMLESRGYPGFSQLMTVLDDPKVLMKIVRFLYGTTIEVPPIQEFTKCLRAALYAFAEMHARLSWGPKASSHDVKEYMELTDDEEKEILKVYDEWIKFMADNNIHVCDLMAVHKSLKKKLAWAEKGKTTSRPQGNYALEKEKYRKQFEGLSTSEKKKKLMLRKRKKNAWRKAYNYKRRKKF